MLTHPILSNQGFDERVAWESRDPVIKASETTTMARLLRASLVALAIGLASKLSPKFLKQT
jgi:hypothetical protein